MKNVKLLSKFVHIHGLGEQFHITFITPPLKAHSWASGETVLTCDFSTEESEGL